jgi:predicted ATPase
MAMPDNADHDLLELSLLVSLGSPRLSISGPGAPEVRELYRRAIELCRRLPDSPHHFAAHWGWWFTSRDNREALDRASHLSKLAEALGQEELILQAHHCQWAIQFCLGDHRRTLEYIEKGLEIYECGNFCHHGMLYGGHDPKACGLGERALSLWLTGQYDQSLKAMEEAVDHARALNHAGTIRHSRDQQIMLFRFRGDATRVLELAKETAQYSEEHGFKGLAAQSKAFGCWAEIVLGIGEQPRQTVGRSRRAYRDKYV